MAWFSREVEEVRGVLAEGMDALAAGDVGGDEGVVLGAEAAGGGRDVEVWAEHVGVELDELGAVAHVEGVEPEMSGLGASLR